MSYFMVAMCWAAFSAGVFVGACIGVFCERRDREVGASIAELSRTGREPFLCDSCGVALEQFHLGEGGPGTVQEKETVLRS